MRQAVAIAALGLAGLNTAQAQLEFPEDVVRLVSQGRCERALEFLNDDLRASKTPALVLAGVMFEAGACVERDWRKAEPYLLRAAERGDQRAMRQLVAGYGSDLAKDPAASLWWAHRVNATPGLPCRVDGYGPEMTPEAFVEQLNGWGLPRVQACTYAIALMAKVVGDSYYPWGAVQRHESGLVKLSFEPARGEFTGELSKHGKVTDHRRWRVGDPIDSKGDLMSYVRNATLKAATRFTPPAKVPPDWKVVFELHFVVH